MSRFLALFCAGLLAAAAGAQNAPSPEDWIVGDFSLERGGIVSVDPASGAINLVATGQPAGSRSST